jgi:cell wall-associated NlpC family hydrolase
LTGPTDLWYAGPMKLTTIIVSTLLVLGTPTIATATPASTPVTVEAASTVVTKRSTRPSRALKTAKRYLGVPYRYGGSTPRGFDCSGYTRYVYNKVGVNLPRRASLQRKATKYVRYPKPGDLVFFHSRGRVYHVGIYAGSHYVYHAPRPGQRVKRERIWTSSVTYGRP